MSLTPRVFKRSNQSIYFIAMKLLGAGNILLGVQPILSFGQKRELTRID